MSSYIGRIISNADFTPKNIGELMEGESCWDSVDACQTCKYLERVGRLKLVRTDGPHYQHKYFVLSAQGAS